MNIETVKTIKQETERNIEKLLNDFNKRTGLLIDTISFRIIDVSTMDGPEFLTDIKLNVKL